MKVNVGMALWQLLQGQANGVEDGLRVLCQGLAHHLPRQLDGQCHQLLGHLMVDAGQRLFELFGQPSQAGSFGFGLRLAFGITLLTACGVALGPAFLATFFHGCRTDVLVHALDVCSGGQLEVGGQRAIEGMVIIIGGGNTAMDAARTARRLGGNVTIVYRRTKSEMPARVEELHHALEEGIQLKVLRSPCEFIGDDKTHFVTGAVLEVIALGEPDASGRRSPVATGETEMMKADLVIMALGNTANPIIKDSEPSLQTTKWGTIELGKGTMQTSLDGIYSGGDAARGGSTAIRAAGDGQAAAREILGSIESGVDIERRILDIVQSCRTNDQINEAFDALQAELVIEIDEAKVREAARGPVEGWRNPVWRGPDGLAREW